MGKRGKIIKTIRTPIYKGPDRRKYIRFGYPFFIRLRENGEKHSKNGHSIISFRELRGDEVSIARNISIAGIRFATGKDFPPETLIRMEVFTPTRKNPFNILARVVWRKKKLLRRVWGEVYEMGTELLEIDAEDEFKHLLEELEKVKLEKVLV